eukprot:3768535-Pyramimonas_sp.AAC.1
MLARPKGRAVGESGELDTGKELSLASISTTRSSVSRSVRWHTSTCRPIARGEGEYARSVHQSRGGRGHMPGQCTNRARGGGICPVSAPIARGEGAYA